MNCRIPAAVPAVLAALLGAPLAHANLVPIDDFETGPFGFSTAAGDTVDTSVAIPAWASHAIRPQREIRIAGGPSSMSLAVAPSDDDAVVIHVPGPGHGYGWLRYEWDVARDLTFGGDVEKISMVVSGTPGKPVSLTIGTATMAYGFARNIQGGGGVQVLTFDLTGFAAAYASQATSLRFYFPAAGHYEVYDIRFGAPGAGPVDFEGSFVATQIPPIPSPPLTYELYSLATANPLYRGELAIADAWSDASSVPAGNWTWDSGPGQGGELGRAAFVWTEPGGIVSTGFDLTFAAVALGSPLVDLYPPDPIHGPESIALGFPVVLRDAQGAALGVSHNWVTLDFDERQLGALEFHEVSVTHGSARSWTEGFTLHFRVETVGAPDEVFPLFHVTWVGDWTEAVPTAAPEVTQASPRDGLRLSAHPSVTAGVTELRTSRPLERAAQVLIHDVTGRRVRSLSLDAGAQGARWDGLDAGGVPVAGGVYFVRVEGQKDAVTRVVRVR